MRRCISRSSYLLLAPVARNACDSCRAHSEKTGDRTKPPLYVTWKLPKQHWDSIGKTKRVPAYEGQTLFEVAQEHELPVEGACGGVCACSTCHVMLESEKDMKLFPEATDQEEDMIDQAFMPTPTSRLGCQLKLERKHDGLILELPKATRNMAVDGHVAKPH